MVSMSRFFFYCNLMSLYVFLTVTQKTSSMKLKKKKIYIYIYIYIYSKKKINIRRKICKPGHTGLKGATHLLVTLNSTSAIVDFWPSTYE